MKEIILNKLNDAGLDEALEKSISGDYNGSEKILRSLDVDDPRIKFNLGWHEIRNGFLFSGMEKLIAGRYIQVFGSPPISGTLWKDEPLENKTLLFRSEGGNGDEIINFRFAKDFKDMGAKVVVACHPSLMQVFSNQGYVCVSNKTAETGGVYYDYWVPAMSAAYVLKYEQKDLIGTPYIKSKKRFTSKSDLPRIGLKWSGNPHFEHEQHRKFDPKYLIDLPKEFEADFYSFQRDEDLQDVEFTDLRNDLTDWQKTSEYLLSMDLVITSCTSIAHMAAALGVKTWVIVPALPYYIWAKVSKKSAWYDSATIYRQEKYGSWDEPFKQIKKDLHLFLEEKQQCSQKSLMV
jgi:hypothetical protein